MARHPLDPVSLVSGVVLLALAGLWFAGGADTFVEQLRWVGPAALVVVGLALVAAARRREGEQRP